MQNIYLSAKQVVVDLGEGLIGQEFEQHDLPQLYALAAVAVKRIFLF